MKSPKVIYISTQSNGGGHIKPKHMLSNHEEKLDFVVDVSTSLYV